MRWKPMLLGLPLAIIVACQAAPGATPGASPSIAPGSTEGPAPEPTTTPMPTTASGIEALVADLVAEGAAAETGSSFLADPIGGQGMTVCLGPETLQTYEFIDHEAALAASTKIDRDDPSKVGNAVVEWNGRPRFWLRDRIIVLYLGKDEPTDRLLRSLLGSPFVEGREAGPGFLPDVPCS